MLIISFALGKRYKSMISLNIFFRVNIIFPTYLRLLFRNKKINTIAYAGNCYSVKQN